MDALEAAADASALAQTDTDHALSSQRSQFTPVTPEQCTQVFDALEDGKTLREAATSAGMSHTTAWRLLRKYEGSLESASKYLATKALAFTEDWVEASANASAKGDHRPAMQALQSIKAIEPIASDQGRAASVAIIIGTPGQPIAVQSPQVLDTTALVVKS